MQYRSICLEGKWLIEQKRNLLGKEREVASDELIDGEDLAGKIERVCNELYVDGYDVVSIVPLTGGHGEVVRDGGYGFGRTIGVIVTAARRG